MISDFNMQILNIRNQFITPLLGIRFVQCIDINYMKQFPCFNVNIF